MKKPISLILFSLLFLPGCLTEHINTVLSTHELHEIRLRKLNDFCAKINDEIWALQLIVEAGWGQSDYITHIGETPEGYRITFAKGATVTVGHGKKGEAGDKGEAGTDGSNGQDGQDGVNGTNGINAPVIGVKMHTDGQYYWTTTINNTTSWLWGDAGEKLPVTGPKGDTGQPGTPGAPGANATTPEISVDAEGYWLVNQVRLLHNGQPVAATGQQGPQGEAGKDQVETGTSGDLLIKEVFPYTDSVVFILTRDNLRFSVPRQQKTEIKITSVTQGVFFFGQSLPLEFTTTGVSEVIAIVPAGWHAVTDFANRKVTVTAPSGDDLHADREGEVTLITGNSSGLSITTSLAVTAIKAYEVKAWNFSESQVYNVLSPQGFKVAEVCTEYLPGYSENQQAIVVYPYDIYTRSYGKGFVVNGGGTVQHNGTLYSGAGATGPAYPVVYVTYEGISTLAPADYTPTRQEADRLRDIDDNIYPITKIGKQYWITRNWKATHYTDGTAITRIDDKEEWKKKSKQGQPLSAYCHNDPATEELFGFYYNGYAILTGKLFPDGWKLPSCDFLTGDNDYQEMLDFLGKNDCLKLRSTGFGSNLGDWSQYRNYSPPILLKPECRGTNLSGFNALPGGYRSRVEDRSFSNFGYWWTSSLDGDNQYNTMDLRNYMLNAVAPGAPPLPLEEASCIRLLRDE